VRFSAAASGGRLVADARVVEVVTGATTTVPVVAERPAGGAPACRAGAAAVLLGDLFGVQRERLLASLAVATGTAALGALGPVRPVVESLVDDGAVLPEPLAVLLGWDAARAVADDLARGPRSPAALVEVAAAARRRGAVFPGDWLGPRIARALEDRLAALPGTADEALALLDLARAADVRIDLGRAQVVALRWWTSNGPRVDSDRGLATLRERLGIVPEDA
jgi:hypothetical protein